MLIRDRNRKNDAGFPAKFVESMTCGTPVIATVFSNILDYLHDGENGFVINNSQSLYDILDKIVVMDAADIIRMKKNCIEMKVFDYHYYKSEYFKYKAISPWKDDPLLNNPLPIRLRLIDKFYRLFGFKNTEIIRYMLKR